MSWYTTTRESDTWGKKSVSPTLLIRSALDSATSSRNTLQISSSRAVHHMTKVKHPLSNRLTKTLAARAQSSDTPSAALEAPGTGRKCFESEACWAADSLKKFRNPEHKSAEGVGKTYLEGGDADKDACHEEDSSYQEPDDTPY